jgi:hypothetical protein
MIFLGVSIAKKKKTAASLEKKQPQLSTLGYAIAC